MFRTRTCGGILGFGGEAPNVLSLDEQSGLGMLQSKGDCRVLGGAKYDSGATGASAQSPILFVTRSLRVGGAENQLALTCRALKRKGLPVKIIFFYRGGALEEQIRKEALEFTLLGKKGRWDVLPFLRKAFRAMHKENPQVIYSFLGAANIICALFKVLRPKVRLIWSVRASKMDLTLYDPIWRVEKNLMRLTAFVPDKIVANSEAGFRELIRQGYPLSKLSIIYNGIDTSLFHPNREEGMKLRKKWSEENPGKRLIGMVARLDPIKDHETLLSSAAILLQKRRDVGFICVGPDWGGRSQKLKEMAADLDISRHVLWEGERTDIGTVYNALDLFTLCSTSEGFPNAVAEAMACGVPCVVTDVGDCAYLVGDTGIVVPPKDPVALARAWEEMLSLDLEEMGRRARERIVKNFSLERMVDNTIKVFEEVLGRPLEKRSPPSKGLEGGTSS